MTEGKAIRALGAILGCGFLITGIVESAIAIAGNDEIVFFWFPALCGGGALILLGVFKVADRPRLSLGLVAAGSLAGGLATAWTLIVPIVALALIVLVATRPPAVTVEPPPA
ncbi:MAG TPA: hypothetical protein VG845_00410 [Dehalococcoidia bacterium]|jgi:hypothetical protein|nr:hypothetical protein [Dehalococcoidia bacterium]